MDTKVKISYKGKDKAAILAELQAQPDGTVLDITGHDGKTRPDIALEDEIASIEAWDGKVKGFKSDPIVPDGAIPSVEATEEARTAMTLPATENILCTVRNLTNIIARDDNKSFHMLYFRKQDGTEGQLAISALTNAGDVNPLLFNNKEKFLNGNCLNLAVSYAKKGKTQYEKNGRIYTHGNDFTSLNNVISATPDEIVLLGARTEQSISNMKDDALEARLLKYADNPAMLNALAQVYAGSRKG